MAREIIRQRHGDMRAQARQDKQVKEARAAAREQRGRAKSADIPLPRVPDYVDGTFRDAARDRARAGA